MTKKKQKGMMLIELLTAMAIFALGIMTIFALFINATQGVVASLNKTNASLLSNEILEAVHSIAGQDPSYFAPGKYEIGVNSNNEWVLIPRSGLVAHFVLSNDATDSSSYGNHGVMENISFAQDRNKQLFNAAWFNANNSVISTKNGSSLQISGPLSISAWVLGIGSEPKIIAGRYDFSEETSGYVIYKQNNYYYFKIAGPQGTDTISASSENKPWEHVVGVYDQADQRMDLYINGQLKNSKETNITSINTEPFKEFTIGTDSSNSLVWERLISDVRVYNRSLTANEVSGLNNTYSARGKKSLVVSVIDQLIGSWSFNEGEGCMIHNNITNDHGRINNCNLVSWAENRYSKENRSLEFTDAQIIVPWNNSLDIQDNISISTWIKMPDPLPENDMVILNKKANGSEDYSFLLIYHENEQGYGWAISSGTENVSLVKSSNTVVPNKWQNIIVTFNGENRKIYIDNNEITDLETDEWDNPGSGSLLSIGKDLTGQDNFIGIIDDLRIYNKILTQKERISIFLNHLNYYLE
jgi:Tfp pilus assembly protein PilV